MNDQAELVTLQLECERLRSEVSALQEAGSPEVHKLQIELQKKQATIQDVRRQLRLSRDAIIELQAQMDALLALDAPGRVRKKVERQRRSKASKIPAEVLFTYQDWHIGEDTLAESVEFLNKYNLSIAEKRIYATTMRGLEMLDQERHLTPIRVGHVAYLADLINNSLHEDTRSACSIVDQVDMCENMIVWQLRTLLREGKFEKLRVYMLCGNHARTTKKIPWARLTETSYETIVYRHVIKTLQNEPIEFVRPEAYDIQTEIAGVSIAMEHGHAVSGGGGIGGVPSAVARNLRKRDRRPKLTLLGHFHQWSPNMSMNFALLGCLCGWNPYGRDKLKAPYSDPSQGMFVFHRGKITKTIEVFSQEFDAPEMYSDD